MAFTTIAVIAMVGFVWLFDGSLFGIFREAEYQMKQDMERTSRAIESLRLLVNTADELSDSKTSDFNFEITDINGHFANFGIWNESTGEPLIQESAIIFEGAGVLPTVFQKWIQILTLLLVCTVNRNMAVDLTQKKNGD